MTARLMPDPGDRILTERELEVSLAVVTLLERSVCASVLLTWDDDATRAYARLSRAGYVEALSGAGRGAFAWDRLRATEAGLLWRDQVQAARCGARDTARP